MKRAVVLGMARSGQAAAALLGRNGVEVVRVDRELGNDEDISLLEGADVLVKSPGVPRSNALVAAARIPIWSEVELAAHYLPNPILGVTGTNGKTTTVEWLGAMFRAAGREVAVAGNVGRAIAGVEAPADAWIVCELSSFQLEDVHELRPRVAVLINLEADHLDRHGSFEAYSDAKLRIFENQVAEDTAVVPRGFGEVPGVGRRVEFSAADALPAEPGLPGGHNRENAAAATAAARAAGLPDDAIAEALRSFRGVAHRLELVAERDGIRFVNDSKATNTAAARRALAAYSEPLHVILGGYRKGESFDELARELHGRAYLIGETAGELADVLGRAGVPFQECGDLGTALAAAAAAARPGEIVLLSPACASYDQFRDFEQRGEEFRRLVQNLSG
ncbi:MAG TPA: UDP-N-acetylmuramoyl-L-alanine--D-glutamate ligase [Gaiellaceae bacterium]|nr:UDP-N-acetylmuramoyl-L-alanine--D-glutamate ligase [Gaiellaceae bacterium]